MLQSLFSAIAELFLEFAWAAVIRFFGLEYVVEIVTAVFGLGCILIGAGVYLFGH